MQWVLDLLTSYWLTAVVWTVMGVYIYRTRKPLRRPKPKNKEEIPTLKKQCLEIVRERNAVEPFFDDMDTEAIERQEQVENLRFYKRFVDRYSVSSLNAFISALRYSRSTRVTKLASADITDEQMTIYTELSEAIFRVRQPGSKDMTATAFYALDHIDDAQLIRTIVSERGIYELKDVKAMLKQMKDDSGSPALAEGML